MKTKLLFFALFFTCISYGQKEIQVAKNSTVLLIFPSPIANQSLGNIYEYIIYENKKRNEVSNRMIRLGYNIKGRGDNKTNLSVVTEDGLLYEFILSYSHKIPKLTHQISKEDAIADLYREKRDNNIVTQELEPFSEETKEVSEIETIETPSSSYSEGTQTKEFDPEKVVNIDTAIIPNNELYREDKETYIYLKCKNTQFRKKRIARTFGKSYNTILRLKSINYDKDELYLYLTLENEAAQAYDIEFIKFSIETIKRGNRTLQEPPHRPPYIYNIPRRVSGDTDHHFIAVFDKFQLGREKELAIEVREKNGERNLVLKIDHKMINNPAKF